MLINPKLKLLNDKGVKQLYNQWFAADDMEPIISENSKKIKAWVYGHTHEPSSQVMQFNNINVPFLCNPGGYPHERKTTHATFITTFSI